MSKKLLKGNRGIKRIIAAAMAICMIGAGPIAVKADTHAAEMRDAFTITKDMGAGWNLGNSLESENHEEYWGNPKTTKAMIDKIREKGFKTLRIPVRWDDNYSDSYNYTIKDSYMNRVEEVVNYGLDNGMYVIINVHHNDLQSKVSTNSWEQQQVKNELKAIWTQVGNRFKNYGDKLIFEVNNEPRCGEDWGGNTAYYDCVNEYNEAARAAIRATGGNNSRRLVMLPTYCASSDAPKLAGWKKLANDDMVAVSIHAYVPFQFAYEGVQTSWNNDLYNSLKSIFESYNSTFLSKGIPVVIGEFGATNVGNTYDREQYAAAYASIGNSYGIPCIWWDNNRFDYGKENFGIFDRYNYSFTYSKIAENIVNAYDSSSEPDGDKPTDPVISGNTVTLFAGESKSSNWGQAVTIPTTRCDGKFDASYIQKDGYFYVEYSGTENKLELILQSMSGGAEWAKAAISETGYINGHYYAKFSYDNCVSAFGTSDFSGKLDKVYVGAQDCGLTVYSFSYVGKEEESGSDSNNGGDRYVSAFWGEAGASNWEQAVSVMTEKNGGSFNGGDVQSNGYFYVEYSGAEKGVELVLQSWSGAAEWAKVNPCEYGSANGHYYAKYSYSDCVSAFGTSDFGGKLDQLHVGAKENWITVYSVCYCYPN